MGHAAARGGFLAILSLAFGIGALRYPVGTFARPGPGLFPLVVSSALLLLAITLMVRSGASHDEPVAFRWRSIAVLVGALVGFVAFDRWIDAAAGIVALVFISGLAARVPSIKRSAILAVVLVAIAFGFERLLGLRLGVF